VAAKKKKTGKSKGKEPNLHAAEAVLAGFKAIDGLDPINLMRDRAVRDCLSTGSLALDLILGGGIQRGRLMTITGAEHVGKTTLLQEIGVSAQRCNIPVVFLDPETAGDGPFLERQGMDLSKQIKVGRKQLAGFYYSQPDSGEEAYRLILQTLNSMPVVREGPPTLLFLLDSFTAMVSEHVDQETGTGAGIASEPRMHSNYVKQVKHRLRKTGAVLVGVNQLRTQIGTYGTPDAETGGKALRYYPDYKVYIKRRWIEGQKGGRDSMGVRVLPVTIRTTKNKCFPSQQKIDLQIVVGRGVDKAIDAQEFLKAIGLLRIKSGRRRLSLKGLDKKSYDLPMFRKLAHQPGFREKLFSLLQKEALYDRFFEMSQDKTYSYDAEYNTEGE